MNNNRNETKKQGRLSRGERAFILENAHIKTPITLSIIGELPNPSINVPPTSAFF